MAAALFAPIALRGLTLANRIVVSSMCQYNAEAGSANDWHLMHLGQFALGAGGLVMTEATHVSPVGRITHKCLGLWSDPNEQALARVIGFCRQYGIAALGIQLAHAGRKGSVHPPIEGGQPLAEDEQPWTTLGPSALPYAEGWHTPRALEAAGLAEVKAQFVAAAERARRIGFDLLELHAAHGYLLHQFLSPISNRRTDAYGGDLERRMRFPLEVFEAVRRIWPPDRPMGVRVSATDWVEGGWTVADTVAFAGALKALGCDFVDVSSGGLDPRQQIPLGPGYQVPFSERIRREAEIPTFAVGMITGPEQAEAMIAGGQADLVALARAIMYDPRFAWHAAAALGATTAYPRMYARCTPELWPAHPARLRDRGHR